MFHYHANYVSPPFQDPLSRSVTYGTQYCAPKIYVATKFCSRTTIVRAEPSDDNNYCFPVIYWIFLYLFSSWWQLQLRGGRGLLSHFFLACIRNVMVIFTDYTRQHGLVTLVGAVLCPEYVWEVELFTWHLVWQCLELHKVTWSCCPFFDFRKCQ